MRGALGVAREIFGGPAELEQLLLELSARPGLHDVGAGAVGCGGVTLLEQQARDLLRAGDLAQHRGIPRRQDEHAIGIALDHEPAVPADGLGEVDRDARRHREARVLLERREHVLGGVAGGASVPEAEAGDAVGVDVLGRTLEFGEDREVVAGVVGFGMRDLEQHGAIGLHDQGTVREHPSSLVSRRPTVAARRP